MEAQLTENETAFQRELDIAFTYHSPTGNQPERYEKIRKAGRNFAETLMIIWDDDTRAGQHTGFSETYEALKAGVEFLRVINTLIDTNTPEATMAAMYAEKAINELDPFHVRTAVMWANAAIACGETRKPIADVAV